MKKSAEDWNAKFERSMAGINAGKSPIDWIKEVQADAEKYGYEHGFNEGKKCGMKDAAEICKQVGYGSYAPYFFNDLILEAMNKLP